MYKALIVEDDEKIRMIVNEYLKKWGYETGVVNDFTTVDQQFLVEKPQIILLDINLPFYDGFYWCQKIRKLSNVPIVFISSRTDNLDMIMAMNMGGDDFVVKPFSLELLVAKMNAILRRIHTEQRNDDALSVGGMLLNLENNKLLYKDEEVLLTRNEFQILCTLMKQHRKIVSRDQIMKVLWDDEQFIDDNTLTVNMNRLRKKLASIGLNDVIETRKSQGYVLL